jgi:mono/diheme cytochrome c family protein
MGWHKLRVALMAAAMTGLAACGGPPVDSAAKTTVTPKGGSARMYGNAQRGKEFVERACTTCHTLGVTGTDGAPALALLKKNPQKTDAYIRGFLFSPHKPMPPIALTNQEIEDIIAYLLGPA